ncbi:zinc ribbon domain-containing protein [Halostella pelagica]|uniref:zinc ribbon domain-containing protein n=1 Tax=Halostella pelagica TaxID=2583824 RepID=UPI0010819770|nr:zinc ribbon domain-containing protein [Halostella pelagica]
MDTKVAVRWAAYYRLLASGSFVVGMAIAIAGISAGLGESLDILFNELGNTGAVDEARAAANVPLAAVSAVVGVLVWQIGKSAAFYWTMSSVIDEETSVVDQTVIREEIRAAVDDGVHGDTAAAEPNGRRDPSGPTGPDAGVSGSSRPGVTVSETTGTEATVSGSSGPGTTVGETTGPSAGVNEEMDESNAADEPDGGSPTTGTRTGTPAVHGDDETVRTGTASADAGADAEAGSADNGAAGDAGAATADDETATSAVDTGDATNAFDDGDAAADGVACGDCGHRNKESVSFCMNCGAEL